ncbi:MAG: hypothetical protein DRI28_00510 [Caldiserica bacterium]|nr:MAG: hypothetical protein DRI28_00510 [Caldisericota bacterium]
MRKKKSYQRVSYIDALKEIEKKKIFPFYILQGRGRYIKNQIIEKLKDALKVDSISLIDGKGKDFLSIVREISSPSFFFSSTLFYVKDAGRIKGFKWEKIKKDNRVVVFDDLEEKIPAPPEAFSDLVRIVRDIPLPEGVLKAWIRKKFKENGKVVDESGVYSLIYNVGADLDYLVTEIEKISLSIDKKEITKEDIERHVYPISSTSIFDISNLFFTGRKGKTILFIEEMIDRGENIERIFYILMNRVINVFDVKVSLMQGLKPKEIQKVMNISPFLFGIYEREAREIDINKLMKLLFYLEDVEKAIKIGKGDPQTLLEVISLKM